MKLLSTVPVLSYDLFGRRLEVVTGRVRAPANAVVIRKDIGAGEKVVGVRKVMTSR
jgi:hypothetical protein